MTDYDSMSVDELRNHYDILLLEEAILKKLGTVEALMNLEADKESVFAALRKAVIREASVGVGTVRRVGEQPLPYAPLMFVPWKTPDGDYDLIPRKGVTATEIQERVLKDKRDYSFFMFGRMNRRKR